MGIYGVIKDLSLLYSDSSLLCGAYPTSDNIVEEAVLRNGRKQGYCPAVHISTCPVAKDSPAWWLTNSGTIYQTFGYTTNKYVVWVLDLKGSNSQL